MTDTLTPEAAFAGALAKFQATIPVIKKEHTASVKSDKGNYSYAYSPLEDITQVAMPLLAEQGLSFTSKPTMTDHGFVLRYALIHSAGHREEGDFPLADPSKSSAQQIGSWLTYARRYALCAVTGIAPGGDDDDAAKAGDARSVDISAPKRAQRTNARDINPATDPDPFAVDVKSDVAWLDDIRTRLDLCGSAAEVRGLWAEMVQVYGEHRLTADDRGALERDMTARMTELKPAEVPA